MEKLYRNNNNNYLKEIFKDYSSYYKMMEANYSNSI